MATSTEIKQRANALADKTDVNSITPKEVGGIMYDLASHSENVLRNGGTLGIRKVYESVAAMEADSTNPKDFWGDPIKKGNLVVIYDGTTTGVDNNKIYAFMKPGWELATKLDAAYATKAETDAKLSELGSEVHKTNERLANVDGIRTPFFELGNVYLSDNKLVPNTSSSKIRMKVGTTIHLYKGDYISINSGYRFYFYYKVDGIWNDGISWKTDTFQITTEGDYYILISAISESTITDVDALSKQITISQYSNSILKKVERLESTARDTIHLNGVAYGGENIKPQFEFGGIRLTNGELVNFDATTSIRATDNIPLKKGDVISMSADFQFYLFKKSDNTWEDLYNWKKGSYTVTEDAEFRIILRYSNQSHIEETKELSDALSVHIKNNIPEIVNKLDKLVYSDFVPRVGTITNIVTPNNNPDFPIIKEADSITFVTGSSNYQGIHLHLNKFAVGSTLVASGKRSMDFTYWFIRIDCYDESDQRIGGEFTTKDNILKREIPEGTARIEITFAANWAVAVDAGTEITFSDIKVYYSDIKDLKESVLGEGNTLYIGEKITISEEPKGTNKCNVEVWSDYTSENIAEGLDAEKLFYKNQSMAIYNDYMFLLSENGGGAVIDYNTKEIISTFDSKPTEEQHANSAQFSNIFYDNSDEFPLLYVSRCGNAAFTSGEHDYDELLVYRVQRNDVNFTFSLINTIKIDATTYGISWGVDNVRHRLYAYASRGGNWQIKEDNPIDFWVVDEPSRDRIISSTPIIYKDSDAIAYCRFDDFFITQGCVVNNGILYFGVSDNTQYVWAIDVLKGKILAKVPISFGMEIEGVAVYNSKLYATVKNHETPYSLKVYEITF